ncbi:MAG: Mut7-C RNAse domain-containing protein [Candidatus Cloacimonetes bacterium]|nr:Mut7-C RNAse domain-containing protein [Candidatus Cloacimonadota bacterium]
MKFIVSDDLGKLVKRLRMLGYDTLVVKKSSLDNIIRIANKDKRIFLTRSKQIAKLKKPFRRRLIESDNGLEQLSEIKNILDFDEDRLFSRCVNCNRLLRDIPKEKIEEFIPKDVFNNFSEFKFCRKCGKYYWKGSHYEDMKNALEKVFNK